MQYSFGSGLLFGKSLNNATPTPVRFGALQSVNIDITFTTKELYGSKQFPDAVGRGTGKITGKASFGRFNAQTFNDLFFSGSPNPVTGAKRMVLEEAQSVTANIVTVTNNATFFQDMGVVLAADGSLFTRVVSAPAGQQYSCNETTGVYTFNSSQNNTPVLVSYTYSDAANGKIITLTNQLLGTTPEFLAAFSGSFTKGGVKKAVTLVLNSCTSNKLTLATKIEDFTIPDLEFEAYADASGNIGSLSVDE